MLLGSFIIPQNFGITQDEKVFFLFSPLSTRMLLIRIVVNNQMSFQECVSVSLILITFE